MIDQSKHRMVVSIVSSINEASGYINLRIKLIQKWGRRREAEAEKRDD
jgi:hypothetical protein